MKKDNSVRKAEMKAAVLSQLKSLIVPIILTLIILVGVLVIRFYTAEEEPKEIIKLNGYEGAEKDIVLENDKLKFVMDSQTTQFSLTVKDTGKVWYSNPENAENDPIALPVEKANMQATMFMTYSTSTGLDTFYNNYTYSIANKIYDIEEGSDYIKVYYSMGQVQKEFTIPTIIEVDRLDALVAGMEQADKKIVTDYYKKYDINKLGPKDDKDALLERFPILESQVCYCLRSTVKDNLKGKIETILEAAGYTYEEFLEDKENDLEATTNDKPTFNVNVIYRLEGNDLVVEIPIDEMESPKEYPIYYICPLPYFGAGGAEDEGYLMVPEGGGALINFNNGKVSQSRYYADMYGWDYAQDREALVHSTETYFNAFGIARNDASFLCILEDGSPYAGVVADVAGKQNSYNYTYAQYSIWHRDSYDMGRRSDFTIYVYQGALPEGETLKQRYRFINSGDYNDMALAYRDYLQDEFGNYLTPNSDTSAPVNLEVVGAIDKIRQVAGVPVSLPLELTRYDEAQTMLEELTKAGLQNVSVKYTGWMNGGVRQEILTKAKPMSLLGGKKDLQKLIQYASASGIQLYLEGITNYAYHSNLLDGFSVLSDAAKLINRKKAQLYPYSAVTFAQRKSEESYYLLKPAVISDMADNLSAAAAKYGTGVAFKDIGRDLNSDYDRKHYVSRQDVMQEHIEKLRGIKDKGQSVMVNTGNNYVVGYCDFLTNMDLDGSVYTIIDQSVPIYQMAIHGYINYSGDSLNLAENKQEALLRSAEYGAALQFTVMNETSFTLQNTLYTEYFGAEYDACCDEIAEIYNRYNRELGHTFNQHIVNHEKITGDLACTEYEDGTKVYVNYSFEDVTAPNGMTVPARDYVVIK